MSGTSLDGVDLVYTTLSYDNSWSFQIHSATTIPYDKTWKDQLSRLVTMSREQLEQLDQLYSEYLAEVLLSFIKDYEIKDLDFICSHGHTALHQPDEGLTYQIGNLQSISDITGHTVICDFRVADVKLGGQGAPLVPIGDQLLFSNYDYCLNLGGFANVSYEKHNKRIAYDICPVNIVLNKCVAELGLDYDDGGTIASKGQINDSLLSALNRLDFYQTPPPKSLGLEWVDTNIFPLMETYELSVEDQLRTFVEHSAMMIANNIEADTSMLITGGGAYNTFLINRIKALATTVNITIPEKDILEYKEALIFGLLGVLKYSDEVNCLSSVTGASKDHASGNIFLPKNSV